VLLTPAEVGGSGASEVEGEGEGEGEGKGEGKGAGYLPPITVDDLPADIKVDRERLAEIVRRAHGEQHMAAAEGMSAMQHLQQTMAMSPLELQPPN